MTEKEDGLIKEVAEIFQLHDHINLVKRALLPPSCGGDSRFKELAHEGDSILNTVLIDFLKKRYKDETIDLPKKRQAFHNKRTFIALAQFLGLDHLLHPVNPAQPVSPDDMKEALEALVAECKNANGIDVTRGVVGELYAVAESKKLLDLDYISMLNLLLQQEKQNAGLPFVPKRVGGTDNEPIWKVSLSIQFQNKAFNAESDNFQNSDDAKRDAARKVLCAIHGISCEEPGHSLKDISVLPKKITAESAAKQALNAREIRFSKSENDAQRNQPFRFNIEPGANLVEWAKRRNQKDPYELLLNLSGLLPEVSGASMYATTEVGEMVLLIVGIEGKKHVEVGIGESKSKARKDAARKIVASSGLLAWLEAHHGDDKL